ncbi:ankyrin repeat domain-containing protein [Sciscionella sediminilitoris]|uniref:ankyrin repeat domain-containing protein n=1 Tax=Sciscionella sediminilitoris TaxID=1445613 RepID=UPI0004DF86D2|nr:ankyrin repeat domain-containing protein [Sciscionella sp. SE31]
MSFERALVRADAASLASLLHADPSGSTTPVDGLAPLVVLLTRSDARQPVIRECARILLDAGARPDGDAFYHACEHGGAQLLELLRVPDFAFAVNHKLDFEDRAGLHWFLRQDIDVNAHRCLHHAIARGRGTTILEDLIAAGADVNLPWDRWDIGRLPLALAARCGHLAGYELLRAHGASAELDEVDAAVLAIAEGRSVRLPDAVPPALGMAGEDYGWILGQFALLDRIEVVRALLDAGLSVDTRGWSGFTPIDQAAMHGRTGMVRLLIERGADLTDCAFDEDGPTPLDCALWGVVDNPAEDGDFPGTVTALLEAGAPTRREPPIGNPAIDALLEAWVTPPDR